MRKNSKNPSPTPIRSRRGRGAPNASPGITPGACCTSLGSRPSEHPAHVPPHPLQQAPELSVVVVWIATCPIDVLGPEGPQDPDRTSQCNRQADEEHAFRPEIGRASRRERG